MAPSCELLLMANGELSMRAVVHHLLVVDRTSRYHLQARPTRRGHVASAALVLRILRPASDLYVHRPLMLVVCRMRVLVMRRGIFLGLCRRRWRLRGGRIRHAL